jgi:D-alanine-D-alanine ligase-like ATP-grasp enzyme
MITMGSSSAQVLLAALTARGMKAEVISRRFNLLQVQQSDKAWFIKGTSFPVNSQPACLVANNKFLTKMILRAGGVPTPKSWLVRTPQAAREVISKNKVFPCVLKPVRGGHGLKVYANIESTEEFDEVLGLVFTKPGEQDVLIEKYVSGKEYRVLVVGDRVSAVMERIPAHVIGNGRETISQLIKAFNGRPMVGKKYEKPLCKIRINGEVKRNLKKQGKSFTYIPEKDERVNLRENSNISTGGIGKDVTESVDEVVKQVAIAAAKAVGMEITGVDVIFDEVHKKAYVLELNDCPGIDIHHYPAIGVARDVAGEIVDYLLDNRF